MDNIRAWLFKQLFQRWIPFKWVDGHKTDISRFFQFVSGLFLLVQTQFPELAAHVDQGTALLTFIASTLGVEIGKVHADDKQG